jgi:hypothetical protein
MTDRRLQNSYLVTGLQPRLAYNDVMILPANQRDGEPVASTRRAADRRRARARAGRAVLVVGALLGTGVLAAACGGSTSGPGVASLGQTSATTGSSGANSESAPGRENSALAYVNCMRTHGEPDMPDPDFSGGHVNIDINASSGVDPKSPRFTAANNACKYLVPKGGTPGADTITPADQADYLKAAACMRSHGIPNFPDPTFQNNDVEFNTPTPIDTKSSQYRSALATCQKLIPAGLPYSSTSGS